MNRFWSAGIAALMPYAPGEQPVGDTIIKLNTNESPFGPSPAVLAAVAAAATDRLRLYPDPASSELRAAIAAYHCLGTDEIFVGNGSDEVLGFAFRALLKQERPLLFPDVTYSFYPAYCALFDIGFRQVPVTEKLEVEIDSYGVPCGGIIFPNPNAPTGIGLSRKAIEKLLQMHPDVVVLIDEAYVDFGGESAVPLVRRYPNLLVVKTLSKSRSLAGLRIGFAAGQAHLIEALERVKNSFNSYPLDRLAQAAAIASFQDEEFFRANCAAIAINRAVLQRSLLEIGFEVLPSVANFVFVRHASLSAALIASRLRERSIFVRHFDLPRISEFLRITVGSRADCTSLTRALREIVGRKDRADG